MPTQPTAIVTGANRGIGLELSRQLAQAGFHVVMTARDLVQGAQALASLQAENLSVELRHVDVARSEDANALAAYLREQDRQVMVLINNAGVFLESSRETGDKSADPLRVSPLTLMETVNINTLGAVRMIQALAPLLQSGARVINVSSWMGQFKRLEGNNLGYRLSKTALNVVTRVMAERLQEQNAQVHSVCPGWVQTAMGGERAELSAAQAAAHIVWLATSTEVSGTGRFWRERRQIDW